MRSSANCIKINVTQNRKNLIRCIINNVTKEKKGHIYGEAIDGPVFRQCEEEIQKSSQKKKGK